MIAASEVVQGGAVFCLLSKIILGCYEFSNGIRNDDWSSGSVLTNDDVAVEDSSFTTGRRGVAATVIVEKIVGSFAETGGSLKECKILGDKVNKNSGSMELAFSSCTVPAAGKPTFKLVLMK